MSIRRHPISRSAEQSPLRTIPVDHALIARLKSSYQLLSSDRFEFASVFYSKLFAEAPHLRSMFSTSIDVQTTKLVAALDAIVSNLEYPEKNAKLLKEMGQRHAGYGVKPEHYDLVIDLICDAIREVGGERLPASHLAEWRVALRLVSDQMIAAASS